MKAPRSFFIAALIGLTAAGIGATMQVPVLKMYENTACDVTPSFISFSPKESCDDYYLDQCRIDGSYSISMSCASSYKAYTDDVFAGWQYFFLEMYDDGTTCGTLDTALVYRMDGQCHGWPSGDLGNRVTFTAGSISWLVSTDSSCIQIDSSASSNITSDQINTNECVGGSLKMWSNAIGSNTTTSTSTGEASEARAYVVAQAAAIIAALLVQAIVML